MSIEILTASRLKAFRSCHRLHNYRYVQCRTPITKDGKAQFGTLFHHGLESWWLAYQLIGEERFSVAAGALEAHASSEEDLTLARELLRGYHVRWEHEPLVTLAAERQFSMPLVNPESGEVSQDFSLSGKIDAHVIDSRDGREYLVEHKTTGSDISEGSTYWKRLRMDSQVSTYYTAFPQVAGCIYDVILRPLQRRLRATPEGSRKYTAKGQLHAYQRAGEEPLDEFAARIREAISLDPDAHYKRAIVVRLERELHEHQFDVWQQAQLMLQMQRADYAPRNPDSCIQYSRPCDYFDVCTGTASIEDERLFQVRPIHPELAEEVIQ